MLSALAANTSLTHLHLGQIARGYSEEGNWAALARALPQNTTLRDLHISQRHGHGDAHDAELAFRALGGSCLAEVLPLYYAEAVAAPVAPGLCVTLNGFRTFNASAVAALGASLGSRSGRLEALTLRALSIVSDADGCGICFSLCKTICDALLSGGVASRLRKLELIGYHVGEKGTLFSPLSQCASSHTTGGAISSLVADDARPAFSLARCPP